MTTISTRTNITWRMGLLACTAFVLAPGLAFAAGGPGRHKTDRAVREALATHQPIAVIVRAVPGREQELRAALEARRLAVDDGVPSITGVPTVLAPDDIDDITGLDAVAGVSADAVIQAAGAGSRRTSRSTTSTTTTTTTTTGSEDFSSLLADLSTSWPQWNALMGSLGVQFSGSTGAGVGVAIVDSGIDGTAAEFSGRISAFYDFTTKAGRAGKTSTPTDAYGHGTHVAGLIGASSLTFGGIAPRVHFVGVKVLDATGQGQTSTLIQALEFLTKNRKALNIHIVNLSLGHPILEPASTDPLVQAVENAVASGLVVVTSAGNCGQNPTTGVSGYAGITSPGNAPSAITAGSLDVHDTADRRDDTVSPFSSRGPTWYDGFAKPDVLAPGHGLFATSAAGSTLTKTTNVLSAAGDAVKLYGTSMAAATTTGVVALLLEANRTAFPQAGRDLPPNAVKAMLQFTAVPVMDAASGAEYDLLTEGAGGLNGAGALALAKSVDPAQAIGAWWLVSPVTESSKLGGVDVPWSRRILWGNSLLLGQAVYSNLPAWQANIVWGNTLIWGETLVWGNTLIWGENVVTSTTLIWGESIVWGDGLLTIDGQSLIWGDTLVWGETLIWGESGVPGIAAQSTRSPMP